MRDFCKVSPKVWRSLKFKDLPAESKLLYLYLLTCPHCNAIGCYPLPMAYITADVGFDGFNAMEDLKRVGLVQYDSGESMVYVMNFVRFNPPTNTNHARMMVTEARSVPHDDFAQAIVEEIQAECMGKDWKGIESLFPLIKQAYRKPIERVEPQDSTPQHQTKTPPPSAGALPLGNGEGGKPDLSDYDVRHVLRDDTIAKAREFANGFDMQYLLNAYNKRIREDKRPPAVNPNLAFPSWVKTYVKDKRP